MRHHSKTTSTLFLLTLMCIFSLPALSNEGSDISFSVIITAQSGGAQEAMVVDKGDWLKQRKLVHTAVLVKHPKGDFLWDSGIGTEVELQMKAFSWWQKQLFKIENVDPAVNQLKQGEYPIDQLLGIIPSHMHWDHVSALEDFPSTPVWVQEHELKFARSGNPPSFIQSQFDSTDLLWHYISLTDEPYEGFARSLDIFKDGSLVLVDLSGHTKGQLGLFINTANKGRYLFIGDTTWAIEGVENNRGRPSFVNWLTRVDDNFEKNNRVVSQLHKLAKEQDDLVIVPAHDENVANSLPQYPSFL